MELYALKQVDKENEKSYGLFDTSVTAPTKRMVANSEMKYWSIGSPQTSMPTSNVSYLDGWLLVRNGNNADQNTTLSKEYLLKDATSGLYIGDYLRFVQSTHSATATSQRWLTKYSSPEDMLPNTDYTVTIIMKTELAPGSNINARVRTLNGTSTVATLWTVKLTCASGWAKYTYTFNSGEPNTLTDRLEIEMSLNNSEQLITTEVALFDVTPTGTYIDDRSEAEKQSESRRYCKAFTVQQNLLDVGRDMANSSIAETIEEGLYVYRATPPNV